MHRSSRIYLSEMEEKQENYGFYGDDEVTFWFHAHTIHGKSLKEHF